MCHLAPILSSKVGAKQAGRRRAARLAARLAAQLAARLADYDDAFLRISDEAWRALPAFL